MTGHAFDWNNPYSGSRVGHLELHHKYAIYLTRFGWFHGTALQAGLIRYDGELCFIISNTLIEFQPDGVQMRLWQAMPWPDGYIMVEEIADPYKSPAPGTLQRHPVHREAL